MSEFLLSSKILLNNIRLPFRAGHAKVGIIRIIGKRKKRKGREKGLYVWKIR